MVCCGVAGDHVDLGARGAGHRGGDADEPLQHVRRRRPSRSSARISASRMRSRVSIPDSHVVDGPKTCTSGPDRRAQSGDAPDRHPARRVRLDGEVDPRRRRGSGARAGRRGWSGRSGRTDRRCPACRGRRGTPRRPRSSAKPTTRAQQPGAEALGLQRGVDRVQVGDQRGGVAAARRARSARCSRTRRPGSASPARRRRRPGRPPPAGSRSDGRALGRPEAHRAGAGRRAARAPPRGVSAADGSANRASRSAWRGRDAPAQRVPEAHRVSSVWPRLAAILASWSSRCSSGGCVEVSVPSATPRTAGAMKKAFIGWAARRSRSGTAFICAADLDQRRGQRGRASGSGRRPSGRRTARGSARAAGAGGS